jgi:hypothetical protein
MSLIRSWLLVAVLGAALVVAPDRQTGAEKEQDEAGHPPPQQALVADDVRPMVTEISAVSSTLGACRPPGVRPIAARAAAELSSRFGVSSCGGRAGRSGGGDHPRGLAVDFMHPRNGNGLVKYALANAKRLGVKYVIWQQTYYQPGRAPKRMANRGSATANHRDHAHISFHG